VTEILERFANNPVEIMLDSLVLGLFQAGPFVLAAIGFTLIYYLSGFINVAYSETITVGAYAAVTFNAILGFNFYLSIIPSALIAGGLSVLTYLLIFRPAMRRGVGPTEMIILSVGVSFLIRFLLRTGRIPFDVGGFELSNFEFFGIQIHNFKTGPLVNVELLGVVVTETKLAALGLATLFAIGLYLFIFRTSWGARMRALAGNQDLAQVSGIDPVKVSVLIWFLAGVAGGLAGIFLGVFSFVNADLGWNIILIVIMISIVGGTGNVRGALVAGITAGIIVAFITQLTQPFYAQIALLLFFIAVLKINHRRTAAEA
jgi:branched-subunit amino acid ABC-type transport system permease component